MRPRPGVLSRAFSLKRSVPQILLDQAQDPEGSPGTLLGKSGTGSVVQDTGIV